MSDSKMDYSVYLPPPFSYSAKIRLQTFSSADFKWVGEIGADELADEGYYATRIGDRVHCGYCHLSIEAIPPGISIQDITTEIHSKCYTNCPHYKKEKLPDFEGSSNSLGNYFPDQEPSDPNDFSLTRQNYNYKMLEILDLKKLFYWESVKYCFLSAASSAQVIEIVDHEPSLRSAEETTSTGSRQEFGTTHAYYLVNVWCANFGKAATFNRFVQILLDFFSWSKDEKYKGVLEQIENLQKRRDEIAEKSEPEVQIEPPYSFLQSNFDFDPETPIGQGGYGKVFRVRYKADRKYYALKYFGLLEDEEENEFNALALLTPHPNIVRYIFAWYETETEMYTNRYITPGPEKFLFIQMELCTGGDLRKFLNSRTMLADKRQDEKVDKLFLNILDAVIFLHGNQPKPIVHRDIKPENVFLQINGDQTVGKLGDFGLTREVSTDMTSRRGTPYYKAPEIRHRGSRNYSETVDVYSLGKLYYEIQARLSLEADEETWYDAMEAVEQFEFIPGFEENHPKVAKLVKEMLGKDSRTRCSALDVFKILNDEIPSKELVVDGKLVESKISKRDISGESQPSKKEISSESQLSKKVSEESQFTKREIPSESEPHPSNMTMTSDSKPTKTKSSIEPEKSKKSGSNKSNCSIN